MSTKTINILEDQPQLSELVDLALAGEDVIIAEGARPLVRLVPVGPPRSKRVAGLSRDAFQVSDDFDEPLPEQFWTGTAEV